MTDAYGRPLTGEPGYFDTNYAMPEYTKARHSPEPRDNPSLRRRESSNARQRSSPPPAGKMPSAPDRVDSISHDAVSPELIAAITEKVKRELFEHLKQTGTGDDVPRALPLQRAPSNKSSSTSSPPPTARRVYTPPSPTQSTKATNPAPPPMEPSKSQPSSPLEKPSGVRFSDRGLPTRPSATRTFSNMELSTIDQKWGRLFNNEGNPTQRLGQFLRGLANHIIDEFPPKKSIVVTPSKMAAYYASHAIDNEPHPLLTIFRAQSNEHISRLFQDLGCQHHLIQEESSSAPFVPSLTPTGFAHWMTIHILAYPEEEAKRLEKVVLAMPIDADGDLVDGKPERLPKQISRYLLPEKEDRKTRKLVDKAILDFLDDLGSTPRRKGSITSPPLTRHSSISQSRSRPVEIHQVRPAPTTTKDVPLERDRKPYAGGPSASESSSNDETIPFERERKPYAAQPGGGKVHSDANLKIPNRPARANSTSSRTSHQTDASETRHHRTQSTASNQNYVPVSRPRGSRRTSSPSFKSFSNSTPDDLNKYGPPPSSSSSSFASQPQTFSPGSHGSNASFPGPPPGPPPIEIRAGDRRATDRYGRRGTEDERFVADINSPRDAEKWDRYQESRGVEPDRFDRPYERGSVSIDPRDVRGAPPDEWYREKGRAADYDGGYTGRRYA